MNYNNLIIKEYVSIILYDNKTNKVWVSKRINPQKEFYQHWQCPGGHVELSDLSMAHAAQRELTEETGIKVFLNKLNYRKSNHYIIEKEQKTEWRIVHIYLYKTEEKPKRTEPTEVPEWCLKFIPEVLKEKTIDSLRDAVYSEQNYTKKIFIEGSCGAGKSTLVKLLQQHFKEKGTAVEVMDESFITQDPQKRLIEYGNNLQKYKEKQISQEEMIKVTVKFETWIRDKWMEQIYNFTTKEVKPEVLIVDRNLFSTLIFIELMNKEGIYPTVEKYTTTENYKYWEFWKREAHVIWWKTSIEENIKRLFKTY